MIIVILDVMLLLSSKTILYQIIDQNRILQLEMKVVILILFTSILGGHCFAQEYNPGDILFDSTGFVEYRPGNLPIILSAPHGGDWQPDSIPDRNCSGCVYVMDLHTRTITWDLYEEIFNITGCYPHVIVNRLHRVKFDANRGIEDAADGNPLVEDAWHSYYNFIEISSNQVTTDYERGMFFDVHGHGHAIQRIELGYLLSRDELALSDDVLNTNEYIEESSIRSLVEDNVSLSTHADLLRGIESFGTMLENKGFPSVPSTNDPHPNCTGSCYFSGGFNTIQHGSRDNAGTIDAIQIELDQTARNDMNRPILVDSLALAIVQYMDTHYDTDFIPNYCSSIVSSENTEAENQITLFPNPIQSGESIQFSNREIIKSVQMYSLEGREIQVIGLNEIFNVASGMYILRIELKSGKIEYQQIVVQ